MAHTRSNRFGRSAAIGGLAALLALSLLVVVLGPRELGQVIDRARTLGQSRAVSVAWFYKPPVDGTSAASLAKTQGIVFLTKGDEKFRDQLRGSGYQGKIFQYVMMNDIDGPAPPPAACDASFQPWPNSPAYEVGDYCSLPEDAFLHNSRGERLYYVYDDAETGKHYYQITNPANTAWQELFVKRMTHDEQTAGYDGIFLDNLDVQPYRQGHRMENGDGTMQEYNDESYRQALKDMLAAVKPHLHKPLWANMVGTNNDGKDWDLFMPYLDGAMNEAYGVDWMPGYLSPRDWQGMQIQAQKLLKSGKGYLGVAQGDQGDVERLRFALSSFMLIDEGDAHFRYHDSAVEDYQSFWDYPELHVDLGDPLGDMQQDGSRWRRDFTCGHVMVNSADNTYEFAPDPNLPTCKH